MKYFVIYETKFIAMNRSTNPVKGSASEILDNLVYTVLSDFSADLLTKINSEERSKVQSSMESICKKYSLDPIKIRKKPNPTISKKKKTTTTGLGARVRDNMGSTNWSWFKAEGMDDEYTSDFPLIQGFPARRADTHMIYSTANGENRYKLLPEEIQKLQNAGCQNIEY